MYTDRMFSYNNCPPVRTFQRRVWIRNLEGSWVETWTTSDHATRRYNMPCKTRAGGRSRGVHRSWSPAGSCLIRTDPRRLTSGWNDRCCTYSKVWKGTRVWDMRSPVTARRLIEIFRWSSTWCESCGLVQSWSCVAICPMLRWWIYGNWAGWRILSHPPIRTDLLFRRLCSLVREGVFMMKTVTRVATVATPSCFARGATETTSSAFARSATYAIAWFPFIQISQNIGVCHLSSCCFLSVDFPRLILRLLSKQGAVFGGAGRTGRPNLSHHGDPNSEKTVILIARLIQHAG